MSNEKLLVHLKEMIANAEASRIQVLQEFAARMPRFTPMPVMSEGKVMGKKLLGEPGTRYLLAS